MHVPTLARGHLLCAQAGPEQAPGEDACATRVRGADGGATCPMCRIALPPAANAIRALSAEQGIAALPWEGPYTRPLLTFPCIYAIILCGVCVVSLKPRKSSHLYLERAGGAWPLLHSSDELVGTPVRCVLCA